MKHLVGWTILLDDLGLFTLNGQSVLRNVDCPTVDSGPPAQTHLDSKMESVIIEWAHGPTIDLVDDAAVILTNHCPILASSSAKNGEEANQKDESKRFSPHSKPMFGLLARFPYSLSGLSSHDRVWK